MKSFKEYISNKVTTESKVTLPEVVADFLNNWSLYMGSRQGTTSWRELDKHIKEIDPRTFKVGKQFVVYAGKHNPKGLYQWAWKISDSPCK